MKPNISPGRDIPHDLNVIIEIPQGSSPIKYEFDKDSGMIHVDRFVATSMVYPVSYGFIPQTLAGDGDPIDALVVMPYAVVPGCVIRARPIGVLRMEDESGQDEKILCLPHKKVTTHYDGVDSQADLPSLLIRQIEHYFMHYKDLEEGKWVKIAGWEDKASAGKLIQQAVANYS